MSDAIASFAFRQARLRTERLRIAGSIFIIFIFAVTVWVRILIFGSHMNHIGIYCALVAIGYEALVFLAVETTSQRL